MKKNLLYVIFASLCLTGFFAGCYEDKSTSGEVKSTVIIDTAGWNLPGNTIEAVNGSTIVLEPTVTQAGVAQPDLSYKWEVTVTAGSQEKILSEIGTERRLEKLVNWTPSNLPYKLVFTVRDNRTGICYIHMYNVKVVSPMGDGVVVGDTRDGGETSDLTLVRNKYVSDGYTAVPAYLRNYYSLNNGEGIPGTAKKILYYPVKNTTTGEQQFWVYMMSDRTLQCLESTSYRIDARFEDLFLLPPASDGDYQTLVCEPNVLYFVYGGNLYRMRLGADLKFGDPVNYVAPADADKKYTANEYTLTAGHEGNLYLYDEPKGRMAWMGFLTIKPTECVRGVDANAYDPAALQGYVQVGSCFGEGKTVYHVLKSPDGLIGLYGTRDRYDATEGISYYETVAPLTTANCPEIGDALFFEGCQTRPVVYYATRTRVYNGVVGQTNINAPSYFDAPAGEEITCMQVFRDPRYNYMTGLGSWVSAVAGHENLLMVATCNGAGEGKVYLLPISGNSGTLGTPAEDQILTGFGRITALGVQGKQ